MDWKQKTAKTDVGVSLVCGLVFVLVSPEWHQCQFGWRWSSWKVKPFEMQLKMAGEQKLQG